MFVGVAAQKDEVNRAVRILPKTPPIRNREIKDASVEVLHTPDIMDEEPDMAEDEAARARDAMAIAAEAPQIATAPPVRTPKRLR